MEQGPWNKRPIDTKSMRKLKDSFKSQGICAFNLDNALPLVLARDHLHPNALNNSVNDPETAPMLQLMDKGLQESALIFAGGHHQRELILQLWESNKKSLGAMETKLEKKKTTLQNKLDKRTTAPLQQLHQEIDDLEKKILTATRSTLWTVKVYDAGKSSILTHIYYLFTKAIFRHRAHKWWTPRPLSRTQHGGRQERRGRRPENVTFLQRVLDPGSENWRVCARQEVDW